jgi:cytochrome P450 family 628
LLRQRRWDARRHRGWLIHGVHSQVYGYRRRSSPPIHFSKPWLTQFHQPVGSLRNLCQLLIYLPQSADLKEFRLKGDKLLEERQKLGSSRKDIFRHLLAEDSETQCGFTQAELNSNANLAIVTGADTTSSTLSQTFGELAKNERVLKKLQKEIDGVGGELTAESTKNLPYLNGVVNEATRLMNPVPSGVQATTSPGGVEVAGVRLPGNIQVQIPHIVLMTDARYFPRPEEFIPERWTDERRDLMLDRRAFIPFGYGVHSCVGKQLALNEMRLVLAKVVKEFDILKGESYDEEKFKEEWMDYAVLKIGAMWVKFMSRK